MAVRDMRGQAGNRLLDCRQVSAEHQRASCAVHQRGSEIRVAAIETVSHGFGQQASGFQPGSCLAMQKRGATGVKGVQALAQEILQQRVADPGAALPRPLAQRRDELQAPRHLLQQRRAVAASA